MNLRHLLSIVIDSVIYTHLHIVTQTNAIVNQYVARGSVLYNSLCNSIELSRWRHYGVINM